MKNLFSLLFFLAITNSVLSQNIVINEILSSNSFSNMDEDGTYQDWIELYNNGAAAVDLSGYGLSDDATILFKWTFPSVSMAPGTYLLVWASEKNRAVAGSPLHTNFKLNAAGNTVILTNAAGINVDTVPATALLSDISYGRLPNGTGPFVFFQANTPNAANSTVGYAELLAPPTFSKNSGFFTTGFDLSLTSTIPGTTVLYTLDGSDPDENNLSGTTYSYKNQYPEHPGDLTGTLLQKSFQTLQYSVPIPIIDRLALANKLASISSTYSFNPTYIPTDPIFKSTVVRAKVIKPGALPSKIASKSYFISPQGNNRFTLPVVSLSLSENKLFDYNNGIFVAGVDFDNWRVANPTAALESQELTNYSRTGPATEKLGNMSYFVNGAEVLNQEVGIRIHGSASRSFQSKGFDIYARSEYGKGSLDYKFFSEIPDLSFKRIILRNSGGDFESTMFRDALNNELVKSLHVQTQAYQPSIVFVNGEYWGILNVREKYDDKYFSRVFNLEATEVDFLENEAVPLVGDNLDYLDLTSYLQANNLADDAVFSTVATRLDPENLCDYFIPNIFFQNADWPVNNIQFWRKKTSSYIPNAPYGHDGRWRWAIHDMDDTYSIGSGVFSHNSLADATDPIGNPYPNPAWSTFLLRKVLENNAFKIYFINRFADLLNTSFLPSRIIPKIEAMKAVVEPEMAEHISRWKGIGHINFWADDVTYEETFVTERPAFQRDHIRLKFGISSNINANLNVSDSNQGYIKMNTIDIKDGTPGIIGNPYPWTGIYFNGIPVKLTAIPKPGFKFINWSGGSISTNPEIIITPTVDFTVTANFAPDATYEASVPIYFWYMSGAIANNVPLVTLNSTYQIGSSAFIQYQSCLVGYPFPVGNANRNKASMERRNSPTIINYRPTTNSNLPYDALLMKGLEIKQVFQSGSLENIMVFNVSTSGFKNIILSFAAMNELAGVTGLSVDYATNAGTPVWLTSGLTATSLPLFSAYQLYQIDFTTILAANDNANFKVRLRFTGPNMTLDAGNRVTFNNVAVDGVQLPLIVTENSALKYKIYPNPFLDVINLSGINDAATYSIYTIEGKLIKNQRVQNSQIDLGEMSKGVYLLQLLSDGKKETHRIIKQ